MVSEPEFLTIARILSPWGTKGEVKVQVLTDFPEMLAPQSRVYVAGHPFTIEETRRHDKHLILKLTAIEDRGAAESLRGLEIEIPRSEAYPLPEGQFYPFQLMGLKVQTDKGEPLGEISDIWLRESNDVYVVQGPRGELLIPAIEDVVKEIDLNRGIMVIEAIEGLF
jgi:16S rRNA processing protein RimM